MILTDEVKQNENISKEKPISSSAILKAMGRVARMDMDPRDRSMILQHLYSQIQEQ